MSYSNASPTFWIFQKLASFVDKNKIKEKERSDQLIG